MKKFLIAGLGNPGNEYAHTRHNIGFDVLDELAKLHLAVFEDARYGWLCKFSIRGRQLILLKPSTYMNLSGNAVRYWLTKENIDIANLLVVTDDINLKPGVLRLRAKGSHGGHNGLRNINDMLGGENYARLRFGAGGDFEKGRQVNFVLGQWDEVEMPLITESIKKATEAITSFCTEGIDRAMNKYNT